MISSAEELNEFVQHNKVTNIDDVSSDVWDVIVNQNAFDPNLIDMQNKHILFCKGVIDNPKRFFSIVNHPKFKPNVEIVESRYEEGELSEEEIANNIRNKSDATFSTNLLSSKFMPSVENTDGSPNSENVVLHKMIINHPANDFSQYGASFLIFYIFHCNAELSSLVLEHPTFKLSHFLDRMDAEKHMILLNALASLIVKNSSTLGVIDSKVEKLIRETMLKICQSNNFDVNFENSLIPGLWFCYIQSDKMLFQHLLNHPALDLNEIFKNKEIFHNVFDDWHMFDSDKEENEPRIECIKAIFSHPTFDIQLDKADLASMYPTYALLYLESRAVKMKASQPAFLPLQSLHSQSAASNAGTNIGTDESPTIEGLEKMDANLVSIPELSRPEFNDLKLTF